LLDPSTLNFKGIITYLAVTLFLAAAAMAAAEELSSSVSCDELMAFPIFGMVREPT